MTNNPKRCCRKCNDIIPSRIKIDGKTHNLKNRKFCLKCSAFKSHNTHPSDPGVKGVRNPKKKKQNTITSSYKRGIERKIKLIESKGGKCDLCGYSKCRRSLSFHHTDPSQKLFGLSIDNLWSKSWDEIVKECDKCQLLCLNCHAEVESKNSKTIARINEKYGTDY
jgi:hypothetical protein